MKSANLGCQNHQPGTRGKGDPMARALGPRPWTLVAVVALDALVQVPVPGPHWLHCLHWFGPLGRIGSDPGPPFIGSRPGLKAAP